MKSLLLQNAAGQKWAVLVCCANLAAIVFLQRLVVPLGSAKSVSWLLPIMWISMIYLLCARIAVVDVLSLLACGVFITIAFVSQMIGGAEFSITSFGLLVAIYVLCPVKIALDNTAYRNILRFYQWCMTVIALLALGQHASQFAGLGIPILEQVVPEVFIVKDFVYLQEIVWGSGLYKPNGVVMLEASFLSQFIALALIIEFWLFRRMGLLMLFAGTLILTFSGTGMTLATIALFLMVWKRGLDRTAWILTFVLACVVIGLVASGWFEAISGRVSEFSREDGSANVRFVAPLNRIYDTVGSADVGALLVGSGAGFIDKEVGFAWNPSVKVWVEYGLVVFVVYWAFLLTIARAPLSPILAIALGLEYHVFGGGALLQPPVVFGCLLLGLAYVHPGRPENCCNLGPSPRVF